MNRWDIINYFIQKNNYKNYLEIGVQNSVCFSKINIENKIGVDPEKGGTHRMTSDEFFRLNKQSFDIIFIDGLHHSDQVYIDINNALKCLNDNGIIICHDMNPTTKEMQIVPRISKVWTGDGWKAWIKLRRERSDLEMRVVDTDWGCGIIRKGKQNTLNIQCEKCTIRYESFVMHKRKWLPLISVKDFHKIY